MPEDNFNANDVPYQPLRAQRVEEDGTIATALPVRKGIMQKALDFVKCKSCKDDVIDAIDVEPLPVEADVQAVLPRNTDNYLASSGGEQSQRGEQQQQDVEDAPELPRMPSAIERSMSNFRETRSRNSIPDGVGAQSVAGIGDGGTDAPTTDAVPIVATAGEVAISPAALSETVADPTKSASKDVVSSIRQIEREVLAKQGNAKGSKSKTEKIDYGIPIDEDKLKLSDEEMNKKPAAIDSKGGTAKVENSAISPLEGQEQLSGRSSAAVQSSTLAQSIINQRERRSPLGGALARGSDDASIDSSQHSR